MDTEQERAGQELKAARLAAGLTQTQVAARAGCSIAMYRHLEAGAIPRTSAVLSRVREALEQDDGEHEDPTLRCPACRGTGRVPQSEVRWTSIQEKWNAGWPAEDIARAHDKKVDTIRHDIMRMRRAGWELLDANDPRRRL